MPIIFSYKYIYFTNRKLTHVFQPWLLRMTVWKKLGGVWKVRGGQQIDSEAQSVCQTLKTEIETITKKKNEMVCKKHLSRLFFVIFLFLVCF